MSGVAGRASELINNDASAKLDCYISSRLSNSDLKLEMFVV